MCFVKPRWPRKMSAVPERRSPRTVRQPSGELAKALALVRAWGAQGGKKRAQRLTTEQRRESARKAALARWRRKER